MAYFWIYYLAAVCLLSLTIFLATFSKSVVSIKKLHVKKNSLFVNWLLIFYSIISLGLVIYLFYLLKLQLSLLT